MPLLKGYCKGECPSVAGEGLASHNFFPPEFPISASAPCSSHPSVFIFTFLAPCQPLHLCLKIQASLTWRVTCLAWCLQLGWCLRFHRL